MSQERILVVEDEADIRELVRHHLERDGYRVDIASDGESALEQINSVAPDLIVLDLMLPGLSGLDICRSLQRNTATSAIPVIIVSAREEESDIVAGLELGADDYVTKPFSPRVLLARVKAVLRRNHENGDSDDRVLVFSDLQIDPGRREVRVNGEEVQLTNTEFRLLHTLARRPGWVFTRYQIVNAVRGSDAVVTDRSVDVQVVGLRKKLGPAGSRIETVRGVGYRFRD